jgi:hypothetical protein
MTPAETGQEDQTQQASLGNRSSKKQSSPTPISPPVQQQASTTIGTNKQLKKEENTVSTIQITNT